MRSLHRHLVRQMPAHVRDTLVVSDTRWRNFRCAAEGMQWWMDSIPDIPACEQIARHPPFSNPLTVFLIGAKRVTTRPPCASKLPAPSNRFILTNANVYSPHLASVNSSARKDASFGDSSAIAQEANCHRLNGCSLACLWRIARETSRFRVLAFAPHPCVRTPCSGHDVPWGDCPKMCQLRHCGRCQRYT